MSQPPSPALPGEPKPVTVHIEKWRAALPPDAWPAGFPEVGSVWRRDVFTVAEAWRAGEAGPRQLLSAVLMWGYGPIGYGPWRAARSLEGDRDGKRLAYALDGLRAPAPDEDALRTAYQRLRDPKESRLPRLGPAFFTKLLYFAGYGRGVPGRQPLILDSVVRRRLPVDAGVRRESGWVSEEWLAYLGWAADQARRRGIEPDEVEMALFHDRWD
ncbi:hypothetical protein NLX85_06030 [Micromonospora sp. A3M-1-15]|uniref:8-oxoguanine DNA glycosylase OGG fold protein n=1 Tax=Micromonospora sp. A3M-1-15 TaxID=2962035 RepID=UPI0020B67CF4|nr:hypothetical protein [Micromonospora sp. A3M-1-15]MCP3782922.1 hypothetical protein [Micromonospora sp. A3M-1-15]